MKEAETAFGDTTSILFGKALGPLADYEKWLRKDIPTGRMIKQAGGEPFFIPDISIFRLIPDKHVGGLETAKLNSGKKLDIKDVELHRLGKEFGNNAALVCELEEGTNQNAVESNFYLTCQNIYRIALCFYTKNSAHCIWSSYNDHSFGCYRNMNSSFCVHCYFSSELTRCFEMDACKKCSDSCFCHNCEGLDNCMFCFNAKSLRYAVANVELGKENYAKIKKMALNYLLNELESRKTLDLDIYNIGCRER